MFTGLTDHLKALRDSARITAMDRKNGVTWRGLRRDKRAQTMLEYALLAGFVAVVGAAALLTAPTTTENAKAIINKLATLLALAAGAAAQASC